MIVSDIAERAAIMEHCGGVPRLEAEHLARTRPWDSDKFWEMPRPQQIDLDLGEGYQAFQETMQRFGKE